MASNNYVKNVALTGAGGNCGRYIAEALVTLAKHKVTAITRMDSESQLPSGVDIKKIDYNDQSSLISAMQGADVLIITLSPMASIERELQLVEAAAAAKVPWIIPNEFSPDTSDVKFAEEMLIGPKKKAVRDRILELGVSSFIVVSTGFWFEWSLAIPFAFGCDFKKKEFTFFDDGATKLNTSTWPQVGRGVAKLLSLKRVSDTHSDDQVCLESYKNGWVYISSFLLDQKEMFQSVLRVTGDSPDDWTVLKEPTVERYNRARERLQAGHRDGFGIALYTRVFFPDGKGNVEERQGLANDVLGLPNENLDEYTRLSMDRALNGQVWGTE